MFGAGRGLFTCSSFLHPPQLQYLQPSYAVYYRSHIITHYASRSALQLVVSSSAIRFSISLMISSLLSSFAKMTAQAIGILLQLGVSSLFNRYHPSLEINTDYFFHFFSLIVD